MWMISTRVGREQLTIVIGTAGAASAELIQQAQQAIDTLQR